MRGSRGGKAPYALDRNVVLDGGGRVLLGGEPGRLVKLSAEGARALGRLVEQGPLPDGDGDSDGEAGALAERLVAAGMLHPLPVAGCVSLEEVTAVIPARNPPPSLGALVQALCDAGVAEVVVVDDGSEDGGDACGKAVVGTAARLLRRESASGPASARNAPLLSTPLVAYLDADSVGEPAEWLGVCAAHFADRRVGLVAPRVVAPPRDPASPTALERYESLESPLDLGRLPGLVGAGRRLSYVPAAALLVRREALVEVGGFDAGLRFGEDVDLVRRLEGAGWLVRYEPAVEVGHLVRCHLASFVRQRAGYGTAAAPLDRRHPGSVAPYRSGAAASVSAGLVIGALAARRPSRGLPVAALVASTVSAAAADRLSRKLSLAGCPRPWLVALRLTWRGDLGAATGLLSALRRVWWPLSLVPLALRPARRPALVLLGAALVVGHGRQAVESARRGGLSRLPEHLLLGLVDDLSYGAGVWEGCRRERSVRALFGRLVR